MIVVTKALTLSLGELGAPIITNYQLGLIVHSIYRQKEYRGEGISLQKEFAEAKEFSVYLNKLINDGVLSRNKGLPGSVYVLIGSKKWEPEEAACIIDPFCYVSHLSAMEYHGITDRIPAKLFLTSARQVEWKVLAREKMKKDLKEDLGIYLQNGLPPLVRTKMTRIGRTDLHLYNSKHYGGYKNKADSVVRVATIGRTFLDMIRDPDLCGGIDHVIKVYSTYAQQYLRLISNEIDTYGGPIDKVRAGYIISEKLGLHDPKVESWEKFAQRGGSRKLDASGEYVPVWSDRWCLSLNVFEKVK